MQRNSMIKIAFLGFCSLLIGCASQTKQKKEEVERPNILVIMCDDLGYADVGFNGSTDIITPNLDKLAKGGTILKAGYVTHPFCGPSRAGFMTGRYPHAIASQFNLPPNTEGVFLDKGIPRSEIFMSKVLKDAGYHTGAIGKWHLGITDEYHPNARGFDDFYGFLAGGHNYFPEQYRAAYQKQKANGNKAIFEYLHPLQHNGQEVRETEYITDGFSREAVRFINESAQTEKPFFLYLGYNAPHTPLEAKPEDMAMFPAIEDEHRRTYAGMVYAVDRGVKRVVDALKENKQFENTLIVFLSDNGGKVSKGANNYPLREGKGSTCEGGYRVPMFFHWPKQIQGGSIYEYPVSALDFYPTFARLAQATIPTGKILDGKDIWDDFSAHKNARAGEYIFAMRHRTGYSDVGVRKDQWKALRIQQEPWKLYNINEDLGETKDVSALHPEVLKELVAQAEVWSTTHQQPQWWHDKQTSIEWKEMEMPHFEKTFKID